VHIFLHNGNGADPFQPVSHTKPHGIPIEFSAPVEGTDPGVKPKLVDTAPVPLNGPEPVEGIWPKPGDRSARSPDAAFGQDCTVFAGEGEELVSGTKKNCFT